MTERQDRVEERLDAHDTKLEQLAERMVRLETILVFWARVVGWIGGGSLVSFVAMLVLLWQAIEALAKTHG